MKQPDKGKEATSSLQKPIEPQSKDLQDQMRHKAIEIYQSGKGFQAIFKASGLEQAWLQPLSRNGENWEQW